MRLESFVFLVAIVLMSSVSSANTIANFRINIDFTAVYASEFGETTRSVKTTGCHKISEVLPVNAGEIEIKIHVDALIDRGLEFTIELLDSQGEMTRSMSTVVPSQSIAQFDLSGDSTKAYGKISRRGPQCLPEIES